MRARLSLHMSAPVPTLQAIADRQAIAQLMSEFAWCADQHDAPGICRLFLSDGRFGTPTAQVTGQAALLAELSARIGFPQRVSRHVWANLRFLEMTDRQIKTAAIQQTHEQDPGKVPIVKISDVADTFRRDAQGQWKFFERVLDRKMVLTAHA